MFPIAKIQEFATDLILFRKSWKTSWAGLFAAAAIVAPYMSDYAAAHPKRLAVLAAVALAYLGSQARDKNVSSEQQAGIPAPGAGISGVAGYAPPAVIGDPKQP